MDVLSDVLRTVRLTGAIFFEVERRAPWVAETPEGAVIVTRVMPQAEHIIIFQVVTEGDCWVEVLGGGGLPSHLQSGDIFMIPMGDPHVLSSHPGMRSPPELANYYRSGDRLLPFTIGPGDGTGKATNFICGYLGCDASPFNPLLQCLPRLLHISSGQVNPTIIQLFHLATAETAIHREGSETVLAKLAELLFVDALRLYVDTLPKNGIGWLSGLRDTHIGAALALLHGRPHEPWTVASLAREVGLSRSVFADRFAHFTKDSPMHYLARWRIQLAKLRLEHHGASIAQVAAEVGYDSEAAFNRAFKRCMGQPPGLWRRTHHLT